MTSSEKSSSRKLIPVAEIYGMTVLEMREQFAWPESFYRTAADPNFLALALAGEVGELGELFLALSAKVGGLCNLMKKQWRGDVVAVEKIHEEFADIQIYFALLADHFDVTEPKMRAIVWNKMLQKARDLGVKWKHDGEPVI